MKEGLAKLNDFLPATVYIPFVTESLRNYTVLRIVPEESRLFLTKERAPFLVCLEVYRPEEIKVANSVNQLGFHEEQKLDEGFHLNMKSMKRLFGSKINKKIE